MSYIYYPGCTLRTKAKELDLHARASMEALGVDFSEPEEWQCCGAVYPLAEDEIASKLSAVRVLEAARKEGKDLLTLCSACHHVIKRVNEDMRSNADIRLKANNYSEFDTPYAGETRVVHFMEMLRDDIGFDAIQKKVVKPLSDLSIGAYYGCMLLRPSAVMRFDDPENPVIMEDFIRAIGGNPIVFSYRNECCGGYAALEDKGLASSHSQRVMDSAARKGADTLVTACPLCQYNLGPDLPALYFTELLAKALGV